MNLAELAGSGAKTLLNVIKVVTLEEWLRSARMTKDHLITKYGAEAYVKFPYQMDEVDLIYMIRGGEVLIAGLIAVGLYAQASGALR